MKRKFKTCATVLGLTVILAAILELESLRILYPRHVFTHIMLFTTIIFLLVGCMLTSAKKSKYIRPLGILAFVVLCICLFYSTKVIDFAVYVLCMITVLANYMTFRPCSDDNL